MNDQGTEKKEEKEYSWNETIKTLLIALVLALTFRSFAYEPFHIPSGSMKSTLLIGDYLFVSKFSYGYSRFSFPFGLPMFKGRILADLPERGDVVVFREPKHPRIDFIKRIIGLPGDKIQVKGGLVFVNDAPLARMRIDDYADPDGKYGNIIQSIPRFSETLPEGKVINILKQYKNGPADNTQVFHVPAGHYFMMGDNRDNSRDSRYLNEVGFVPYENLIGRASMVFFSVDPNAAEISNPLSWLKALRLDRFLMYIY